MIEEFNAANVPEKPERSYLGVVTAKSHNVRCLIPEGAEESPHEKEMMAVYDTALPGNVHHADVFQITQGRNLTKSQAKQVRRDLALVFTKVPLMG